MTPRSRITVLNLVATGTFLVCFVLLAPSFLLSRFAALEQESGGQQMRRVLAALQNEARELAALADRHARRDAALLSPGARAAELYAVQFSEAVLRDFEIDLVYVADSEGREVFSAELAAANGSYVVPAGRQQRLVLARNLAAMRADDAAEREATLLRLPEGLAWFAARPILATDRTGAHHGALVLLRRMSAATIARMSKVTQLPVSIVDLAAGADRLPARLAGWVRGPTPPGAILQQPLNENLIAGYLLIADVSGAPTAVLATQTPRTIYRKGIETTRYLVIAVTILVTGLVLISLVQSSRLQRSAQTVRETQELYRAVVEQAEEGVLLLDASNESVVECNPALAALTCRSVADLLGVRVDTLFAEASHPLLWNLLQTCAAGASAPCELRLARPDGAGVEAEVTVNPIMLDERRLLCLLVRNVSQRRREEVRLIEHQRKLEHLANHDPLTGLHNRLFLNARVPELLREAERDGQQLAICYIDLDNFKDINDSSGHDIGDQVLRITSERLRRALAADDIVARISGDEFVVVASGQNAHVFDIIARRITEVLRAPMDIDGRSHAASVSVGIAVYPRDGQHLGELLRSADLALYHAKSRGKNNHQFFEPQMNERLNERLALEHALRTAIAEGQISVHYQPIVDLRTESVAAFEALARWRHPQLGNVPPARFIPVAEESGLICDLGNSVLRQVCSQLAAWASEGLEPVPVAINVSARQMHRVDLEEQVLRTCTEHAIAPSLIQLEITESDVMREIKTLSGTLEGLRAAGVKISIDDFGTGYSSLSYLKHLPIDHLKIDRSFVRDMAVDSNDAAIVNAIISMANSLRLETIAEGVETAQQALRLSALGCDLAQGYHYSAALTADECGQLQRELARRGERSIRRRA